MIQNGHRTGAERSLHLGSPAEAPAGPSQGHHGSCTSNVLQPSLLILRSMCRSSCSPEPFCRLRRLLFNCSLGLLCISCSSFHGCFAVDQYTPSFSTDSTRTEPAHCSSGKFFQRIIHLLVRKAARLQPYRPNASFLCILQHLRRDWRRSYDGQAGMFRVWKFRRRRNSVVLLSSHSYGGAARIQRYGGYVMIQVPSKYLVAEFRGDRGGPRHCEML